MHISGWSNSTRREHPRADVSIPIELRMNRRAPLHGHMVNVSRGGMLAQINERLAEGTRCVVQILEERHPLPLDPDSKCPQCGYTLRTLEIPRQTLKGRVLRTGEGARSFVVAVEFETLLMVVEARPMSLSPDPERLT